MKKLTCEVLLICDQTILSKENKISLIGIFDQIYLSQIPGSHPKLSLVGIVSGEPNSEHKLTISIKDANSALVYPDQILVVNLGSTGKSNLVAEFVNLPVKNSGLYSFSLTNGKTLLKNTHLSIVQINRNPSSSKSKIIN